MPELTEARAIRIEDAWSGLNTAAPVDAQYDFRRTAKGFDVSGNFSMGDGVGVATIGTTAAITVPTQEVESFLGTLEPTSIQDAHYQVTPICCDDYPLFTMVITLENNDSVTFESANPSPHWVVTPVVRGGPWYGLGGHSSWGVTIESHGTEKYLSDSARPDEALSRLYGYLGKDEIEDTLSSDLGKKP